MVHRQGSHRAPGPGKRSGARTGCERHVRARRPLGLAYASAGTAAQRHVGITLIAARPITRGTAQAGGAFATPSVVHFAVVLLLSAIVSAPWGEITIVAGLWGFVGLSGIAYVVVVVRRMRRQSAYRLVFEDWLFHVVLPLTAYTVLAISAYAA